MEKDELIELLQAEIEQLKRENAVLKECIRELEAKLANYENPHTPPSLKHKQSCIRGYFSFHLNTYIPIISWRAACSERQKRLRH
jgi:hypothetical protein